MIYKYISCKEVISKTIRDYGLTSISDSDAISWVGDAVEKIGYHTTLVDKFAKVQVTSSGKIELPCDFFRLNYFLYNNQKLSYGNKSFINDVKYYGNTVRMNNYDDRVESDSSDIYLKHIVEEVTECGEVEVKPVDELFVHKIIKERTFPSKQYYYIDDNCGGYTTNVEDTFIIIFYKAFPVDEKGYPKIIDEIKYRTAVSQYIFLMMLQSGFKHPVIDYPTAFTMSGKSIRQASSEHFKMTEEQHELFRNNWSNYIHRLKNEYEI